MARTVEAHRRQQVRKRLRMQEQYEAPQWQVYRICDLCEKPYCANNYQDKKIRVKRWKGLEVCAFCQIHVLKKLPRLIDLKIMKYTKAHR